MIVASPTRILFRARSTQELELRRCVHATESLVSCLDAALIPAATWNASTAGLLPNQCGMLSQPDALSDCGEYYIIVDMIPFGGGCWPSS